MIKITKAEDQPRKDKEDHEKRVSLAELEPDMKKFRLRAAHIDAFNGRGGDEEYQMEHGHEAWRAHAKQVRATAEEEHEKMVSEMKRRHPEYFNEPAKEPERVEVKPREDKDPK